MLVSIGFFLCGVVGGFFVWLVVFFGGGGCVFVVACFFLNI